MQGEERTSRRAWTRASKEVTGHVEWGQRSDFRELNEWRRTAVGRVWEKMASEELAVPEKAGKVF